jgi:hypothetical protein
VEGQPGEDPCGKEDDEEDQEERIEHGGSPFSALRGRSYSENYRCVHRGHFTPGPRRCSLC